MRRTRRDWLWSARAGRLTALDPAGGTVTTSVHFLRNVRTARFCGALLLRFPWSKTTQALSLTIRRALPYGPAILSVRRFSRSRLFCDNASRVSAFRSSISFGECARSRCALIGAPISRHLHAARKRHTRFSSRPVRSCEPIRSRPSTTARCSTCTAQPRRSSSPRKRASNGPIAPLGRPPAKTAVWRKLR